MQPPPDSPTPRKPPRGEPFAAASFEPWVAEPIGPHVAYLLATTSTHGGDGENFAVAWADAGYVDGAAAGLYGLLDGMGDWTNLHSFSGQEVWRVVAVDRTECKIVDDGGGVVAPRGWTIFAGDALRAMRLLQPRMCRAMQATPTHPLADTTLLGHAIGFAHKATLETRDRHGNAIALDGDARAWGPCGIAAAFGYGGRAEARGYRGAAITGRRRTVAWAYGEYGRAITLESNSAAFATGRSALTLAVAGYTHSAAVTRQGIAAGLSVDCAAMAMEEGAAIFLVEYAPLAGLLPPRIVSVFASRVGESGILPGRYYKLRNGVPVEVDEVIGK